MLFTVDGLERAFKYLQNGLDIIGDNELLYAGLGFAHVQMVNQCGPDGGRLGQP